MSTHPTMNDKSLSELLGMTGMDEAERDDMLERMGQIVMESVLLRAVAGMTDEDAAAFDTFVGTDPEPAALYTYLSEKIPDIEDIFAEEAQAFREECIDLLARTSAPVAS